MAIESSVVFLPVTDIEQTTQFYRDVIGLSVVQEQVGGSCRISIQAMDIWDSVSIRINVRF